MKATATVLALAALAGCLVPDIPEDATLASHSALPGLELAAWTEPHGDRIQMHVVASNHHDAGYWYRINCGHPWNVTLTGPEGPVGFRHVTEPAGCAPQYEIMQPKQHIDSLWSWDVRDHDPEQATSRPVPDGTYWWNVTFAVRDHDQVLGAGFRIVVANGVAAVTPTAEDPATVPA